LSKSNLQIKLSSHGFDASGRNELLIEHMVNLKLSEFKPTEDADEICFHSTEDFTVAESSGKRKLFCL